MIPTCPVRPLQALVVLLCSLAAPVGAQDYTLPDACAVDLVDDLELHATEAGILHFIGVKEGARVRAEDVLVKIDTSQVEKAREVAKYDLRAAVERARNDVEIRYSVAAEEAAEATVAELLETNQLVEKAVTEADLRQARLEHRRAELGVEKAQKDKMMAGLDAWTKKAEFEAAELAVERRTLRAPFTGIVIDQFREEKEWVNPGDPILRLVRLDELQVEGLVPIAEHSPAALDGCEVTVTVSAGGGRQVTATGRIVFIKPILVRGVGGQNAVVRAEVTNREENGHWVLLPKMNAQMTIHLGTGGAVMGAR